MLLSIHDSMKVGNAATGALVAEGTETHACVHFDEADPKKISPVPVPDDLRAALGEP